jgi:sigma-B regulation protein RsbU (phosphoserine phosphatase)
MDRILIADSSVQNTELMRECLGNTEYEVITAESGFNALAKVDLFKPDLVIIDTDLNDISGYDVCKKIKDNPTTQYILVLIVSVRGSIDAQIRAMQVGSDDFMEKTFDAYVLISKIQSLLRLKYLSEQLKQKYIELEEKNNILEYQLKMSKSVQRSLLPKVNFTFNNVGFYSKYLPAMDIGGDFYDIIEINNKCVAVVLGDVSGHGISAALLTSMLNLMIKNLVAKYFNPDQLLFYLNNEFYKIFENSASEMYACVFYAVLDTNEKKIYYSNAGQTLPMFASFENNSAFELDAAGLPIGLIKNSKYEYKVIEYQQGDILFFYTDGLVNTFYKDSPNEFITRLNNILVDCLTIKEPAEIVSMALSSFYDYDASGSEKMEQDDVSVLLCRM